MSPHCGDNLVAASRAETSEAADHDDPTQHEPRGRTTERYIHVASEALAQAARGAPTTLAAGERLPREAGRLPTVAHDGSAKYLRTQQDSNLRPSAPENEAVVWEIG